MKKLQLVTSLFMLSAVSLTAISGCGNSENSQVSQANTSAAQASSADESSTGSEVVSQEDTAEINMAFYCYQVPSSETIERIEGAINAITVPEIATEVHLMLFDAGSWEQQMNLALSSGEKLDLMTTFFYGSTTYDVMSSSNQLMPLNDLLEEYGQGILDTIPEEYLATTTNDGNITAVPCYKDSVSELYYLMNTDVLNELGIMEQAQSIRSMEDIEEILTIVRDQTDMIPIVQSTSKGLFENTCILTGDFEDTVFYDKVLNDYIIVTNDEPEKVQSLYDLEEYQQMCRIFERWYSEKLIDQDAPNSTNTGITAFAQGNIFSMFSSSEYSTVNTMMLNAGQPVTMVKICDFPLSTGNINTNNWVIPVNATEPEAAMKFLNMMYTDKRIIDLLNFGELDVDYVVNEDGTYGAPEGMDLSSIGWHLDMTFLFGNQFLSGVWEGSSADIRTEAKTINDNASRSPIFGFKAYSAGLDTQQAGVLSASSQYVAGLQCGSMSVEENFPQFRQALEAAGIGDIIDNVQEQLDNWKNIR